MSGYIFNILIKDHNLLVFSLKLFLQGMVFDLEKGSTLYIDLAKSNSRSKRHRSGRFLLKYSLLCCFFFSFPLVPIECWLVADIVK